MAELGFPVPPPPPNGTLPEPAAVGGVRYQRFPDPRSGGETTLLPEIRDLTGDTDAAKGHRLPRPTRPTSPAPGLSFAPGSHAGGRLTPDATPTDAMGSSGVDPANPELGARFEAGERIPESSSGLHQVGGRAQESSGGLRHLNAVTAGDATDLAAADASGLAARPERGGGRRNLRGAPGHRAPDDDSDTVGADQLSGDDAVSSSGRHTVPDELVRASTYRLPPDRVFRAKVRDNNTPPDDPTTRLVPKPRQS